MADDKVRYQYKQDRNGLGSHLMSDDRGGQLEIAEYGAIHMKDKNNKLALDPYNASFSAQETVVVAGSPKTLRHQAYVDGKSGKGLIICEGFDRADKNFPFVPQDRVNATVPVVESVTRERIATFMSAHPDIASYVKNNFPATPITQMNGKPATLSDLGEYPSQFKACPASDRTKIVERK